jgi:hypothetical protein
MSIFLTVVTLCTTVLPAYAAAPDSDISEYDNESTVIYYDDGSYITISAAYVSQENISTRSTTNTVTGAKDVTFTDSSGNLEWKYTLSATFSVTYGSSVSCTKSTYTNNIYDSSWTFSNGSATKSGNAAYGIGHYTKKVLFITTKNYDIDISITCDKNGKIS